MQKERFIWVLGVALVCAVAYGYYHQRNMYQRYIEFRENEQILDEVKEEIEALKRRVEQAQAEVKKLGGDPVEIEAAIRRDRRLTRDGEIIFRIAEPPGVIEPAAPDPPRLDEAPETDPS